ncbi:MAG: hypothetical protein ACI9FN_000923 [Saprospiraceae bacterium]|jgi:hypothetical protein
MTTDNSLTATYLRHMSMIIIYLLIASEIHSQSEMIFTRSFTKKLKRCGIEFYHPVERWMKVSSRKNDTYLKHDIILHSPPDVEVRIKIITSKKNNVAIRPQVYIPATLASIATNNEKAFIRMRPMSSDEAMEKYGADRAIIADFVPKEGYTNYPKGRMLSLYKEDQALINYIVLYEDKLDPYFDLPVRFKIEGALEIRKE